MNLPPVKRQLDHRPPTFGRLPDRLTEGNEDEEQDAVADSAGVRKDAGSEQQHDQRPPEAQAEEQISAGKVLVSRAFEINEFMGYGARFLTRVVFSIGLFEERSC